VPLPPSFGSAGGSAIGSYDAAGGPRLAAFLDSLPLRNRWLKGHPVCWQSGQQNGPPASQPPDHTHCSAFAAAVALYLDIYLLRPPHHDQLMLAEAQTAWLSGSTVFSGPTAAAAGWVPAGFSGEAGALAAAVQAANAGRLVLACYAAGPVAGRASRGAGHVAILRPQADPTAALVPADGPDVIMAGAQNYSFVAMKTAFAGFPGAWPDDIALFSHETALQHDVSG